jgi:hypothetical protein
VTFRVVPFRATRIFEKLRSPSAVSPTLSAESKAMRASAKVVADAGWLEVAEKKSERPFWNDRRQGATVFVSTTSLFALRNATRTLWPRKFTPVSLRSSPPNVSCVPIVLNDVFSNWHVPANPANPTIAMIAKIRRFT